MVTCEGGLRLSRKIQREFDLSVITICYNDFNALRLTVESVAKNLAKNVEYIIIDGRSSDETVPYLNSLSCVEYWRSEPDSGIYDAMNKGIALSTGRNLLFLNAGDFIEGDVPLGDLSAPSFLPVWYKNPFGSLKKIAVKSVKKGIPNCHQGIVFENKKLAYNTNYKIASDFDFFIRHGYDHKLPMEKVNGRIVFDSSGISSTLLQKRDAEVEAIIRRYYGWFWSSYFRFFAFLKRISKKMFFHSGQGE